MLIVPRKRIWTQQPQGAAQVDQSNVFGSRVIDALFGAPSLTQNGKPVSLYGSIAKGVYSGGVGYRSASNGGVSLPSDLRAYNAITIVLEFVQHSRSGSQVLIEHSANQNTNPGSFIVYTDAASGKLAFGTSVGGAYDAATIPLATIPSIGRVVRIAVRLRLTLSAVTLDDIGIAVNGVIPTATATNSRAYQANFGNYATYLLGRAGTSLQADATLGLYSVLSGFASDAELEILSANPWQIFRAPDSRIFVPTGAGAGSGDSLTASSIIASPATVGSPLLSQQHALSASSIAAAPAVVASPAITQRHALSATAVSASPAVVGSPSITQKHALSATAISAASAVVGSPTLTEIVAGVLSALPIIAAPAVIGAPAITQRHALSAGAISAGPVTFGTPTLAQQHALMAQGITASPSVVGAPVLSEGGAAPFTAEQLLYLDANYVTIANISDIAAAVLAALQASAVPFPVNAVQMNDAPIIGDGTEGNRWRGVGVPG